MPATRRLFFGLELTRPRPQEIVRWRAEHFAADIGYPVAAANLHLTLAFLGEISARKQAALMAQADRITQSAFTLTLDDAGHWPRSRVIWLGMRQPPRGLLQLASLLRAQAARSGCAPQTGVYHPHITLYHQAVADVRLPAPGFRWQQPVSKFALFAAEGGAGGTRYRVLARWPLAALAPPEV